jgi:hypothetical protein
MVMTQTKARSDIGRWSIAAAVLACTCNVSSSALLYYQRYLQDIIIRERDVVLNYPYHDVVTDSYCVEIINQCIFLAPLLVVIIFRHVAAITFMYALMLCIILAGRVYHVVQLHLVGIDAVSKFGWEDLASTLLGAASLAIALLWAFIRSVAFIGHALKPRNGADTDG